jgi:hypothetical protein
MHVPENGFRGITSLIQLNGISYIANPTIKHEVVLESIIIVLLLFFPLLQWFHA